MFTLEIAFKDGVSQPEMILIRRPQALIGSSDYAHVLVEDMKTLNYQLHLVRDLGRKFRCKPVGSREQGEAADLLEGVYVGETTIDTGPVKFFITALDFDLALKETEPPDRAGVRVLRQACSTAGPTFPALVVKGTPRMVISFVPEQPVYIGRSNQCALRLDAADISAKHARMGFESGEFWIEDLGSTNGTFVNQQQVAGRLNVGAAVPIVLGREITIIGVMSEEQLSQTLQQRPDQIKRSEARKFPLLISVSEVARPARMVIPVDASLTIGRDPQSDMWLGAPHVSRKHCVVSMNKTGKISVTDCSTNGTGYADGILRNGDMLEVGDKPRVLDFGGDVTVALCFTEGQEKEFVASHGSAQIFSSREPGARDSTAEAVVDEARGATAVKAELSSSMAEGGTARFLVVYRSFGPVTKILLFLAPPALVAVFIAIAILVLNM